MAQPQGIRFEAGVGDVLGQLTEQQLREREANAAAAAVVRDYKKTEGPVRTAEEKKALIDEGYKAKRRYHEKRLLVQDPGSLNVGDVLKRQTPLLRREMYRRRLFPIRFEETAVDVEEAEHLVERQPVGRLVVALLYLAALLLFLSYALEITRIFEGSDGIRAPIRAALAPTPSNFNSISFQAATASKAGQVLTDIAATPVSGRPADLAALNSKAGVAAWLLYGFVPLLYGQTSRTSNMGSARVIGNCFRLTFRQVQLEAVDAFDLGYEGVWPLSAAGAGSSIAQTELRSENPLTNPPSSPFVYSYPFAAPDDEKAFHGKGGYYQVVCADSAAKAQEALQQNQSGSVYPPWLVPLSVIGDRRTVSAVVDFFTINPVTETFSHSAVLFSFTSGGTVQRPLIWISSLIAFSSQSDMVLRYTSLGLMVVLLVVFLVFECAEAKRLEFTYWMKEVWSVVLFLHLALLLGFLASFAAVQIFAARAPKLDTALSGDGYYASSGAPTAAGEEGFFQLVTDYGSLFSANSVAQQACTVFGALAALTACVLTARFLPAVAGLGTKSLQATFQKVKWYLLACCLALLAIMLIFVSLGNISFGADLSSFTGYYESLTTSAAFLLGGILGNYDVYKMMSVSPVLAGIFFVPLFLMFSMFGFTILTAVVLRKHDLSSTSIEQTAIKYKLDQEDVFRTRYEWLRHKVANAWRSTWRGMSDCFRRPLVLGGMDEREFKDDREEADELKEKELTKKGLRRRNKRYSKEKDESVLPLDPDATAEDGYNLPPQYPPWVWQTMGMADPMSLYSAHPGEQQGQFYVNPESMADYSKRYGYFSGFDVADVQTSTDCYFTPQLTASPVAEAPAPSVPKVYLMVRNQMQEDHEDAWKKLLVVAFVAIIVAAVSLQLSVNTSADARRMASRTVAATSFPLEPITFTCPDLTSGSRSITASVTFPNQPVLGAKTTRDLYGWLASDQGLMSLLTSPKNPTLAGEVYPKLSMPDGTAYEQLVLSNWNSAVIVRSARVILMLREAQNFPAELGFSCESTQCEYQPLFEPGAFKNFLQSLVQQDVMRDAVTELAFQVVLLNPNPGNFLLEVYIRFPRTRGGVISPNVSVEVFDMQPYGVWSTVSVVSVALQVASGLLLLYFGFSFFLEFRRLWSSLKREREDFSCGLCLGVFFVDDLFNLFDVLGFCVLGAAVFVWVLHIFSYPHSQSFNLAQDLAAAAAAAAAGGTQEVNAAKAAAESFSSFSSTAALLRAYAQLAAAVLAVAFLRLLRLGRKRKRMTNMFFTLASAADEMVQVLMGTTLVFIGFAYLCFLSFGTQVECHSTIKASFISTFLLTIGYFPLSLLFHADSAMAGAFIFPYLFFMGIVCFSFFLCVLRRSLAYRTAEIKVMERLGRIEKFSVLGSLRQFFLELFTCRVRRKAEKSPELELQEVQRQDEEGADFGNRMGGDQPEHFMEQDEEIQQQERRRREMPLKVADLPPNVVTSVLSDEQYAALPEEVQLFAQQEAASFVDRFRLATTQFQLGGGDVAALLQQLADNTYNELFTLARNVAEQEGHLQHELSVYTTRVVTGQQRITSYITMLEQGLQDKEQELQVLQQELKLLEARSKDAEQEAARYNARREVTGVSI